MGVLAGASLFALAWVKLTRLGPVVAVMSEERGWGVHSGDLLGLVPLGLTALWAWKVKA